MLNLVFWKIPPMEEEIQRRRYHFLPVGFPFLLKNRENFCRTRAQSAKLVFQENLSSGRPDTDEKVYYPPSKVPFIFDRSLPNI
jgi:hypothetical protein